MECPQCGSRTEVCEKRGPFRDRRCINEACRLDFTTREQVMMQRKAVVKRREHGRLCARTRATQIETPRRLPATGAELGSTPCLSLAARPDPVENASAVQEELPFLQAEVAA